MLANLREIAQSDPDAAGFADVLAGDEPALDPCLNWIWRAWHRLSQDRPQLVSSMGEPLPLRIPWSMIILWADRHGMQPGECQMLDFCFGEMDQAYLTWWHGQRASEAADA